MEEYQSLMKAIAILDKLRGQHRVPCHCRVKGIDPTGTLTHSRDYLAERALAVYNEWVRTR